MGFLSTLRTGVKEGGSYQVTNGQAFLSAVFTVTVDGEYSKEHTIRDLKIEQGGTLLCVGFNGGGFPIFEVDGLQASMNFRTRSGPKNYGLKPAA